MSYFLTKARRRIDLNHFTADSVCLEDIAHHLTKICRFGGSLPLYKHYSVAQHSLELCRWARNKGYSDEFQRQLLMHDASEAYLGDVVSSVKKSLPDYIAVEEMVQDIIENKYSITQSIWIKGTISYFDKCILLDEAQKFWPSQVQFYAESLPEHNKLGLKFIKFPFKWRIKRLFLAECARLNITD